MTLKIFQLWGLVMGPWLIWELICLLLGCDWLAGPQQLRIVRQTLSHRRPDRGQTCAMDSPPSLLQWDTSWDSHPAADQQVAWTAGPHNLLLPSNQRQGEDGVNVLWWSHRGTSPRGQLHTKLLFFDVWWPLNRLQPTWWLFRPASPPWWANPSPWTSWDKMLEPWSRRSQRSSRPSETLDLQCKSMFAWK